MQGLTSRLRRRLAGEVGEGVISTGIAVLIMALIGALMWVAFRNVFTTASTQIEEDVNCIATDSCAG